MDLPFLPLVFVSAPSRVHIFVTWRNAVLSFLPSIPTLSRLMITLQILHRCVTRTYQLGPNVLPPPLRNPSPLRHSSPLVSGPTKKNGLNIKEFFDHTTELIGSASCLGTRVICLSLVAYYCYHCLSTSKCS